MTAKFDKVHVDIDESGFGKVRIGGNDITGVYAVSIEVKAGQPARLVLHVYGPVEFEGVAEVTTITDTAKRFEAPPNLYGPAEVKKYD